MNTYNLMKTIFKQLATAIVLGFLVISPVLAQNAAPLEAATNNHAASPAASEKTGLDNEKHMDNSRSDNHRSLVHYLSWDSWVIFAIVFGVAGLYVTNLRDKRRHETIRLMIEKGTPVTPELLDGLRKKSSSGAKAHDPHGYLCWGITEVLVAIALFIVFPYGAGRTAAWIVLAVGVANLILWFIDRAHSNGGQSK